MRAKLATWTSLYLTFAVGLMPAVASVAEAGGSDYVAVDMRPAALASGKDWQNSSIFHTPACQLDKFSKRVQSDLQSMYKSGQRKLALLLWHARIGGSQRCRGYLLNSAGAAFRPGVIANILQFLRMARSAGFQEVEVRFVPQWINNPRNWRAWDSGLFDENQGVIGQTISAIEKAKILPVVFDLGAELGGLENKVIVERYVKSLWSREQSRLGRGASYGFSIAYAPGRLTRLIEWLKASGGVPAEFALDIYKKPFQCLQAAAREARGAGIAKPVFLIQETYYDDHYTYQAFVNAARAADVEVRAIVQWPLSAASAAAAGGPGWRSQISEPDTRLFSYQPAP